MYNTYLLYFLVALDFQLYFCPMLFRDVFNHLIHITLSCFIFYSPQYSVYNALAACSQRPSGLAQAGGVRCSSCGLQTFIFPLHFPRRYTPACAKPPVVCRHCWECVKSSSNQCSLISIDSFTKVLSEVPYIFAEMAALRCKSGVNRMLKLPL